jgi:hypothetical protein
MDRGTRSCPRGEALSGVDNVENLLLFVDDDLRETALALGKIEGYLVDTLGLLERSEIKREQVQALASHADVLDDLDHLCATLESLRRRMAKLALNLKK